MKKENRIKILTITIVTTLIMGILSITMYSSICAPKFYDNFINTGEKYLLEGKYEEAILEFSKAIKIEKKSTEARVYLAKGYFGNTELDKGIDALYEAQQLDISNEKLLKEILEILNDIDSDVAYEFLNRFINAVGKENLSDYINKILNSAKESPNIPIINPEPQTYIKPIAIKLKLDKMKVGHSFYYTTDGTDPNENAKKYRGKIDIDKSTTIKLIGYNKNNESTDIITLEYIIDTNLLNDINVVLKESKDLLNNTKVGTNIGNTTKEAKKEFELVIDKVSTLLEKELLNYEEASNLKIEIENAVETFKDNIIEPTDKSKLQSTIDKAQNLYNNSKEGNKETEYKIGSKRILQQAINRAKEVYENILSKQDNIDKEVVLLEDSISNFERNKNNNLSYLKAYYNFLKSYEFTSDYSTRGFNLAYINNDSIPELIVFDGDYHAVGGNIYAYVNGKVKDVGGFGEWGGFEYQEKKGIIRSYWFGMGNAHITYCKWNGSKLSTIMSSSAIEEVNSNGDVVYKYYINDKEVTLSKYDSSIAPYEKGLKSVSVYDSYAVTDSVMRDKLLK